MYDKIHYKKKKKSFAIGSTPMNTSLDALEKGKKMCA